MAIHIRRREFIFTLGGAAAAWPLAARAQPSGKTYRIGFLGPTSYAERKRDVDALRSGLRQLGYEEGRNIVIDYRWAEGRYDRLAELAAELVKLNVDVIVTASTPGAWAAKQATSTIPIVMAAVGDPVAAGIVASLARPSGNLTGLTFFFAEICAKRVELIKEAIPDADPGRRFGQSCQSLAPRRSTGHAGHGQRVGRGTCVRRRERARRYRRCDCDAGGAAGSGARGHRRPGVDFQR